jgi:hypothetical protein
MLRFMFIVRGMSEIDSASFACGTTERALDKVLELLGRRFQDISVTDRKGASTADEFQRAFQRRRLSIGASIGLSLLTLAGRVSLEIRRAPDGSLLSVTWGLAQYPLCLCC